MRLRHYQRGMVRDVRAAFDDGAQSVVLQLPTGGGKTVIASTFMRDHSLAAGPIWFVCHRREILGQTSRTLAALNVPHGVIAPGKPRDPDAVLQVCSVESLRRMASTLPAPGLVIWDECHHIAARTWATLKAELRDARHLGLTATPARLDGKGLGEHFDRIVCGPDTRSLIEGGHLSPYRAFGPSIPDLRGVKTKAGDFDRGQLAERMGGPVIVGCAVEHYKRLAPGSRAVAFAASVDNSKAIVARFNAAGVPALHVDGKTPPAERDAAVEALRDGRVSLLSNVEVFTEGFDLPAVEAIILLRPTKSYALFRQMVGRGLRPAPGKARVVIQDHAGLIYTHGMPDDDPEWTLKGASPRRKQAGDDDSLIVEPRLRVCPKCSAIHEWAQECPECSHEHENGKRSIDEIYGLLLEVAAPPGCETQSEFARRLGISRSTIRGWMHKGLPSPNNLHVEITSGIKWVKDNFKLIPPGCETVADFARRVDLPAYRLYPGRRNGVPSPDGVHINVELGIKWVAAHFISAPEGCENYTDFGKRIKVDRNTVKRWVKEGLPHISGRFINVSDGIDWVRNNDKVAPPGVEGATAFSKRMGVNKSTVSSWIRSGMPCRGGKRIDISAALEWVRMHKNITPKDAQ